MSQISNVEENLTPLKRSLLALDKLQRKLNNLEEQKREPIAVIGIGCRAPGGVTGPDSFWRLLCNGVDAIREYPRTRGNWDDVYDLDRNAPGKLYVRQGGYLEEVDRFDAEFFGISPREALSMDPQQRILLETSWEALERAGQCHEKLSGSRTGVFMGVCFDEYSQLHLYSGDRTRIDSFCFTGTAASVLAGRLSYFLGTQGPSITLDTACSSSLVAVHLACQSLRAGECDLALAGGVSLILSPENTIYFCKVGALSADGRCKTFDASADGYARGEGCGVVVLKRLSAALGDGDPVLAVIRGSAVNQDGQSNGLTAPNGPSQVRVIRDALSNAGIRPSQVSYVEAHGTGTPLGDPIEARALGEVYREGRLPTRPLYIGSVKTNLGHLEAAAGVTGLIKVVLSLQHKEIVPHLHFKKLNPLITLDDIPAEIPVKLIPWEEEVGDRYAGLSAFGISGTNAHLVLQEAPETKRRVAPGGEGTEATSVYMLPISARTDKALCELAQSYRELLVDNSKSNSSTLADICYTSSLRRTHHDYRLALTGRTHHDLIEQIDAFRLGESRLGMSVGKANSDRPLKIVFVFPGQGSQWFGMGRQLMAQEPVFRQALESCEEAMKRHVDWSLMEQLLAEEDSHNYRLRDIDVIQPTLLSIEIGLAALWRHWGVEPDAVIGHSVGEMGAAHVAGALTLSDVMQIVCRRGRLLRRLSGKGAMAAVELTPDEAEIAIRGLEDKLSIGVYNSPRSLGLSGDPVALNKVLALLEAQDVFCRLIKIDTASHSPQMESIKEDMFKEFANISPQRAEVPIYSTVQATVINGSTCDPNYWVNNLIKPVLFSQMTQKLLADDHNVFIEMSPHPILLPAVQQGIDHAGLEAVTIPSLVRGEDEPARMISSLGRLYTLGYPVKWSCVLPPDARTVPLPSYPWQREQFWLEMPPRSTASLSTTRPRLGLREGKSHALLGEPVSLAAFPSASVWELELSERILPALYAHRLGGVPVLAASAFLELAGAAGLAITQRSNFSLNAIAFEHPLDLLENRMGTPIQLTALPAPKNRFSIRLDSRGEQSWRCHVSGEIRIGSQQNTNFDIAAAIHRCKVAFETTEFYEGLRKIGVEIREPLQNLTKIWWGDQQILGQIQIAPELDRSKRQLKMEALDSCFQLAATLASRRSPTPDGSSIFIPHLIENVRMNETSSTLLWVHVQNRSTGNEDALIQDIRMCDEEGTLIGEMIGLQQKRLGSSTPDQSPWLDWLYEMSWEPVSLPGQIPQPNGKSVPWIIFSDRVGCGEALARLLRSKGQHPILVFPSDSFSSDGEDRYLLNPKRDEDFSQLLKVLGGREGSTFHSIVHLWNLGLPAGPELRMRDLEAAQLLGCGTLLNLVQSLHSQTWQTVPKIWIVTQGSQPVNAPLSSTAGLAQTPVCGLSRVLAEEHPELWGGLIDIDEHDSADSQAINLWSEISASQGRYQVAYREGKRYQARLTRVARDLIAAPTPSLGFREDSSYLLTGGLGGIGCEIAKWMVAQGARHLILLGRSHLPSRAEWNHLSPESAATRKIKELREMEELGASVHYVAVDVADENQLTGFIDSCSKKGWPPIRGVIHAAAIAEDSFLVQMGQESLHRVLRPKVFGGWLLHRLLGELDFFVLFSSIGSFMGLPGQGSYAAANAFLDGLAHFRNGKGQSAMSVNWGAWRDAGFAATAGGSHTVEFLKEMGIESFSVEQGLKVLDTLLHSKFPQVVVLPIRSNGDGRSALALENRSLGIFERITPQKVENDGESGKTFPLERGQGRFSIRERLLQLEPDDRLTKFQSFLQEQLSHVLKLTASRIDLHKPVNSMGMTSLLALEFRNRLENELGVKLSATMTFNYPTLARLAPFLANKLDIPLHKSASESPPTSQHFRIKQGSNLPGLSGVDEISDEEALKALTRKDQLS
ncbi:MAG: type I polyketide synthase [Terriglobia bacterium]